MLAEISLKNFKLFPETGVTIQPGLITVFIGPNGAGKSSVLQALMLLKQSAGSSGLQFNGPSVDLGSYQKIVHRQDEDRLITMGLAVSYSDLTLAGQPLDALPVEGVVRW